MDLKGVEGGNKDGENGLDKSDTEEGVKAKDVGSISSKDMFFRADKIDFKSWDVQLEKHLSRVWSRDREAQTKKEVWEIDLPKLDIRSVIAHGTYGTVYRGTYDGQDVAVKVLDWGEDGIATAAETAALRASFQQEVAVWQKLDHPNVTKREMHSSGEGQQEACDNHHGTCAICLNKIVLEEAALVKGCEHAYWPKI